LANACFESYAEFMVFAAALGYKQAKGEIPPRCKDFLDNPYPIDLGIFKSQQVFPLILLIAMAHQRRYEVARDDEVLCDLVEDYAALGCGEMTELLRLNSSEVFHLVLAELMAHHCDARPARASATS